jgi:hypothetical protein
MDELARYTVEVRRPQEGWEHLQQATARARRVAHDMRAEGTPVRLLRSIFVPEDDTCFLLYEALSSEAVRTALRRADLSAGREVNTPDAEL